jgi:predicted flap endonuclease-1-like 5' DNA nuclease
VDAADDKHGPLGVRSPVRDGANGLAERRAADELDRGSGIVSAHERKCGEEGVEHFAQPTSAGG